MQSAAVKTTPCSTSYSAWRVHSGPGRLSRYIPRASPVNMFDMMDRQFAEMDRQFERMSQQMDQEFESAMSRARLLERQANAEAQRALRESAGANSGSRSFFSEDLRPTPNVDIQRQEERGPGTYRYYERIQITSGRTYSAVPSPAATTLTASSSSSAGVAAPVVVGALVVAGGYAALTAAFNRHYSLTTYAESKRWLLLLLWPLLLLFSPKFREQFAAAVRGERVPPTAAKREGGPGGGSGSGGL